MERAIYRSSVVSPARETLIGDNLVYPSALAVDFTGKQAASIGSTKFVTFEID